MAIRTLILAALADAEPATLHSGEHARSADVGQHGKFGKEGVLVVYLNGTRRLAMLSSKEKVRPPLPPGFPPKEHDYGLGQQEGACSWHERQRGPFDPYRRGRRHRKEVGWPVLVRVRAAGRHLGRQGREAVR